MKKGNSSAMDRQWLCYLYAGCLMERATIGDFALFARQHLGRSLPLSEMQALGETFKETTRKLFELADEYGGKGGTK